MPSDDYISVPSTGKLKLKGISNGRVDKKKKKKSKPSEVDTDTSVVLGKLDAQDGDVNESAQAAKETRRETSLVDGKLVQPDTTIQDQGNAVDASADVELRKIQEQTQLKTESERRFDEQRRKRLEEKLKREGVKTHKQRVEELNKYLSGLSEHHDMPRIGPG